MLIDVIFMICILCLLISVKAMLKFLHLSMDSKHPKIMFNISLNIPRTKYTLRLNP